MLEKCQRLQWSADDLDWSVEPRRLSAADEVAVVQYFTDMAGIERLAAQLFAVQRDNAEDPTLRAIFETFVVDEERHAIVAERLARHYDARRLRDYETNPSLLRFGEVFTRVLHDLAPEIANAYITSGEILLDVALLRSLDDYVDDEMSHQAMRLINRDESRHIAMDYFMTEHYASPEYVATLRSRPKKPLPERARLALVFMVFLWRAGPFLRDVFFRPMDMVDPEGRRMREAFKRIQLVGTNERVAQRPFSRFLDAVQRGFNHPTIGPLAGPLLARLVGMDPRYLKVLYTEEEEARARRMSLEELANETLAVKTGEGTVFA